MFKLKNILGRMKNRINKRLGEHVDCWEGKAEPNRTFFDDAQMEEPSPYLWLGGRQKREQKESFLVIKKGGNALGKGSIAHYLKRPCVLCLVS